MFTPYPATCRSHSKHLQPAGPVNVFLFQMSMHSLHTSSHLSRHHLKELLSQTGNEQRMKKVPWRSGHGKQCRKGGGGPGGACPLQFLFMGAWRLAVVHLCNCHSTGLIQLFQNYDNIWQFQSANLISTACTESTDGRLVAGFDTVHQVSVTVYIRPLAADHSCRPDPREPPLCFSNMSTRAIYRGPRRKLVLAFDVGTKFSGISFR